MPDLMKKITSMPLSARLLLAVNLLTLVFALIMQFGFGVFPCILCLWQRAPYAAAAILSLLAFAWKPYGKQTAALFALCAALYLSGMGLAFFHSGVERHWWQGTESCSTHALHGTSPDELRAALLNTSLPPCDQLSWTIFGLSMANINIAASFALALFATLAFAKATKDFG